MEEEDKSFVEFETSMGPIKIELYWDHAPKTCKNFYTLAKQGYYDNTIFHRVIKVCSSLSYWINNYVQHINT